MKSIMIHLTEEEMKNGKALGKLRYQESRRLGCKTSVVDNNNENDIRGARAEIACAKAVDIPFVPTVNTFKNVADIGLNIEVRSTTYTYGRLVLTDKDPDDRIYILVRAKNDNSDFLVVGWMYGYECKKKEWLEDYGTPAYYVPNNALKDMVSLWFEEKFAENNSYVPNNNGCLPLAG